MSRTSDATVSHQSSQHNRAAGCPYAAQASGNEQMPAQSESPSIESAEATSPEPAAQAETAPTAEPVASPNTTPPSPDMPGWLLNWRFLRDPFALIADVRQQCGDLFQLDVFGLGRTVFLCSPEHLREVYKMPEEQVVAGEIRGKFFGDMFSSKTSLSLDGPAYAKRRRITTPFFTGRKVDAHAPLLAEWTDQEIDGWQVGQTFELQSSIDHLSRKAVYWILFGSVAPATFERLSHLASNYLDAVQWNSLSIPPLRRNFGPWSPWARFVARKEELERALHAAALEIDTRQAADPLDQQVDTFTALLAGELADDPDEARECAVQEVIAFLVGGAETIAKSLAWTIAGLYSHPTALSQLRRELEASLGRRAIGSEDLRSLPYLEAVAWEGLRYQAVGVFAGPRLTKQPVTVGSYAIPANTVLVQALRETGQNPIFRHLDGFEPDNFLKRGIQMKDWVPFGGGRRICSGMGLAEMELKVITATLARRVDLDLLPGYEKPSRAGIAFQPHGRLKARITGISSML